MQFICPLKHLFSLPFFFLLVNSVLSGKPFKGLLVIPFGGAAILQCNSSAPSNIRLNEILYCLQVVIKAETRLCCRSSMYSLILAF